MLHISNYYQQSLRGNNGSIALNVSIPVYTESCPTSSGETPKKEKAGLPSNVPSGIGTPI